MSYLFNELMAVFTLETHNPSSIANRLPWKLSPPFERLPRRLPSLGKQGGLRSTFGSHIARHVLHVLETLTWKRG